MTEHELRKDVDYMRDRLDTIREDVTDIKVSLAVQAGNFKGFKSKITGIGIAAAFVTTSAIAIFKDYF